MQFLQKNDAIINLKEDFITIDGIEIEIFDDAKTTDEWKTKLLERTKFFTALENQKNDKLTKP